MVTHVHKNRIVAGDVIVCLDGRERTICQGDIRYNSLMGVSPATVELPSPSQSKYEPNLKKNPLMQRSLSRHKT
jgi:hypothetical protein